MPRSNRPSRRHAPLWRVEETSAGGLVVDTAVEPPQAVLIGKRDRGGQLLWSLPKGHVEAGETAEQAAAREIEEETGIKARLIAPLGEIDYWFVFAGRRPGEDLAQVPLESLSTTLTDRRILIVLGFWVILNIVFGQGLVSIAGSEGEIAWEAHIGGFLFGLLCFGFFDTPRKLPVLEEQP